MIIRGHYLTKLERIPTELKEKIFLKLFETAEISKFNSDEYKQYEASVNAYRDILNIKNTAFEKREVDKAENIALEIIKKGFDIETIQELTGLTEKEIIKLKNS